ncbi:MAG TPA: peptidoglycan DD-metalloendopeptidase family protein, partial [Reyranella sp.]|nr:peptidoglycan DD-metalloendopeptidase family protein [Reyranella sp.]
MNRIPFKAALAAVLCSGVVSPVLAASPEETRLLGSDREEAQYQSYMPFTRVLGASGTVSGSLAESAAEAGVPPAAMVEALAALGTAIDLERDLRKGDCFYVRYERTFTAVGNPVGIGKVLWAELRTEAKGTVAIHRFRTGKPAIERFYLSNGQVAAPPEIRLPLQNIAVSSGFGLRADPFDQPARGGSTALRPTGKGAGGPAPSPLTTVNVPTVPAALGSPFGLKATGAKGAAKPGGTTLMMHDGVDLAAEMGTPIRAAGDGGVVGAELKGGYGNWVEIEHDSASSGPLDGFRRPTKLMTVYGHLSAFAPGVAPGMRVKQGEVIGFVGSTGRSTGPHLHFEILNNGKPTNPMINLALRPEQLRGGELERFKKTMMRDLQERQHD